MNSPIRTMIRESYPKMEEMPFCSALKEGRFGRTEILRSEIVELYRALNTRGRIQDIYKRKLQDGMQKGSIHPAEVGRVEDVIDDEGETDEHIDHLDMRFKLFDGTVISRASTLRRNDELESINKAWTDVCEDSDILTLMTVMAAIEDWYSPALGVLRSGIPQARLCGGRPRVVYRPQGHRCRSLGHSIRCPRQEVRHNRPGANLRHAEAGVPDLARVRRDEAQARRDRVHAGGSDRAIMSGGQQLVAGAAP